MTETYILILLTLIMSALFSGSEIAFVVANRLKIEIKAKKKSFLNFHAHNFLIHPQKFFSISLVGTNISNVAFSSLMALFLTSAFGIDSTIILIITIIILLLFGEIIPKIFFRENADFFIPFFTLYLLISNYILFPIIKIVMKISQFFIKIFKVTSTPEKYFYTKEDVHILLKESESAGKLEEETGTYLSKTFDLKDTPLRDVMVPRIEIEAVPKDISIKELYNVFKETKHSNIIVYEESIDNIIGMVYIKDLFKIPDSVSPILRNVIFVPESKSSSDMLQQFLVSGKSLAVVVDEFGGTSGLVTISDILEEVLGEIEDDHDIDKLVNKKIAENTFLFSGRLEIDLINDQYEINIPTGNYVTLSGFISENIGRVPKPKEIFDLGNFRIKILMASKTKIELVQLVVRTADKEV